MTAPDPAEVERLARVEAEILIHLARLGLPTEYQDILVSGAPMRGVPPMILARAILSAGYSRTADTLERAAKVADLLVNSGAFTRDQRASSDAAESIAAAIRAAKGEG